MVIKLVRIKKTIDPTMTSTPFNGGRFSWNDVIFSRKFIFCNDSSYFMSSILVVFFRGND